MSPILVIALGSQTCTRQPRLRFYQKRRWLRCSAAFSRLILGHILATTPCRHALLRRSQLACCLLSERTIEIGNETKFNRNNDIFFWPRLDKSGGLEEAHLIFLFLSTLPPPTSILVFATPIAPYLYIQDFLKTQLCPPTGALQRVRISERLYRHESPRFFSRHHCHLCYHKHCKCNEPSRFKAFHAKNISPRPPCYRITSRFISLWSWT